MNGSRRFLVLFAVLFVAPTALAWQAAPPAYFEQNCSSCHTIGSGPSVGPDLKNVTQRASRHWLVEFIRDPDAKIAAKDPYATKIVAEAQGAVMTGSPEVTEEFGEALLEYIDQQSGAPTGSTAPVAGDTARGRELFLGKQRLSNGAAACVACHQASGLPLAGGRLGPNLSLADQKLGGDRGLASWLHSPPTKMMSTIFRSAPLTAEEAADLTAFLHASADDSSRLSQAAPLRRIQLIGIAGSLLAFVIAGVFWRGRIAIHGVRRQALRKRGGQ